MANKRRARAKKADVEHNEAPQATRGEEPETGPTVGANGLPPDVNAIANVQETAFTVDPEFRLYLHELSREEEALLERSIAVEGGPREPLVVWKGPRILLDGHHRYRICNRLRLPYRVTEIELPNRTAALAWMEANQRGRRNDTPAGESYRRGRHYAAEKSSRGGSRLVAEASGQNVHMKTEQRLANHYKVSARTIRRDAVFAEAVDLLASQCGTDIRRFILTGGAMLSQQAVFQLAKMKATDQRRAVAKLLKHGTMPVAARMAKIRTMRVPVDPKELASYLKKRLGEAERHVFTLAWEVDESN